VAGAGVTLEAGPAAGGALDIDLRRVSKAFGPVEALRDISADVRAGEFLSIIGPSGCGKTTLLKIIAGLIPARPGSGPR